MASVVVPTAESARVFDQIEAAKRGAAMPAARPIKLWDDSQQMQEIVQSAVGPAEHAGERKMGSNAPCPCGCGKKLKNCHGR